MKIALIVALGKNRVIGKNNQLPWHLPADLHYFKKMTLGKPIIMGRKTFESIGRVLPGRQNIVVTKNQNYQISAVLPENTSLTIVHSLAEAVSSVPNNTEEVMIIGGSSLFVEALPLASHLYLTEIEAEFEGDCFFPEIDFSLWQETAKEYHKADEKNPYNYCFIQLKRR